MKSALVLFSHGSPDPDWAEPLRQLEARVARQLAPLPVRLTFLPPAAPGFAETLDALAAEGIRHITVAPVFLARGGHVKKDLPEMAAAAEARLGVSIKLLPTLGESPELLDAMAAWIAGQS